MNQEQLGVPAVLCGGGQLHRELTSPEGLSMYWRVYYKWFLMNTHVHWKRPSVLTSESLPETLVLARVLRSPTDHACYWLANSKVSLPLFSSFGRWAFGKPRLPCTAAFSVGPAEYKKNLLNSCSINEQITQVLRLKNSHPCLRSSFPHFIMYAFISSTLGFAPFHRRKIELCKSISAGAWHLLLASLAPAHMWQALRQTHIHIHTFKNQSES